MGYVVTAYVGFFPFKSMVFPPTDVTQVVTGLTNGTRYRFRVQALSADGASGYSLATAAVTPMPAVYVVFDGQSMNLVGDYPSKLMATQPGMPFANVSIGGRSWTELAATAPERLHGLADSGQTTVLIMNGGTRDLFYEGDDGPTLYADERSYAELARAAGFDYIIGTTTTPAEAFSLRVDARRRAANALLVENEEEVFDGIVDFDADLRPALSLHDSDDAAAYPDGVHWSPEAAQAAAALVEDQLTAILGPARAPSPPAIGAAYGRDQSALLTWTAPASDGRSPITGYVVTPFVGPEARTPVAFDSTSTVAVVPGLTNGLEYSFTVAAVNEAGTSGQSAASRPVVVSADVTVPGAPTVGSAVAGNGRATVSWTAPISDGRSPVTGYVVTPYVGYRPQQATTFSSTATTQVVTGLRNGTEYRFRVQAINGVGVGSYSQATNSVTPAR